MRLPGFAGPSNVNRSVNADDERSINLYPEAIDAGTPKSRLIFHKRPGFDLFAALGAGPVRQLFQQDGRCFGVGGTRFYEVFASGNVIQRGTVALDGNPATISSNGTGGNQLFVTSGGFGYIYDLEDDTLELIADDGFPLPVLMGAYTDGYFVALQRGTGRFYLSALMDGTVWSALDVNQVSQASDIVQAMVINHREIWLFGSKTTSIWVDTGDANNPFQPLSGTLIEHGIAAPFSAIRFDNGIFWVALDEYGQAIVVRPQGYTPVRISTHAVETYLNRLPRIDDAIGWGYQEEGHAFYHLYCPQAETTWVYDVSNGLWHERAIWDTASIRWYPHLGRCHAFAFGKHLIGDRQSAAIYQQSLTFQTDALVIQAGL